MTYMNGILNSPIVRVEYKKLRYDIYSEDRDNWYAGSVVIPKNQAKVIHVYETELLVEYNGRIYQVIDSDTNNYLLLTDNDDVIWIPKNVCQIIE